MGYSRWYNGSFELDKPLTDEDRETLIKLASTRRMKREGLDEKYGIEGEFYLEDDHKNVVDANHPPKTQPGLWCQWVPTEDGMGIEADGCEKFYEATAWIRYINDKILIPRGYKLSGAVDWVGDDTSDTGTIYIIDGEVTEQDQDAKNAELDAKISTIENEIIRLKDIETKYNALVKVIKKAEIQRLKTALNANGTLEEFENYIKSLS